MPNLNIYLVEGFSQEQKARLMRRVTDVVAQCLAAPLPSIRIFLIELPKAHICVGGEILAAQDSCGLTGGPTVHAFLIAGRSDAQKEAMIAGLTEVIEETLGIPAEPVRVMFFDIANTDFGMKGLTAKSLGR
ncbi:tautomerase family protein [Thauera sp.]|uniref:tautomerase family protein n=1 Tax=Thauera sp. TaxID=1905334 RepID=UPI0039E5FE3F